MLRLPIRMRSISFIALLGLLILGRATTGYGQWKSIGPDGAWVEVVMIDPETPTTVYAATERGGVYKSTDAGAGWRLMTSGIPTDLNVRIRDMVIDPNTPRTLYLGTGSGVFKTTDGAHSWAGTNEGLPANDRGITALGLDPSNPSTLFIGTGFNRLYRSTDAAGSWQQVVDGSFGSVDAVAVAPSNSSIVYRGAGVNMVFKSTDGGDTWESVSTGLENAFVFNQITVHPTDPDIVYAASDTGLFKTTNGGTSWAMLNTPPWETGARGVESVVLDPSNPVTVYATTDAVIKSTDSGDSWVVLEVTSARFQVVKTVAIDPDDPLTLYAGENAFEALFKSTDGGTSWEASNSGLSNIHVTSIAFDPQNPSTRYAASRFGGGVHKSEDSGQTWESKRDSVLNGFNQTLDVVVDPLNPSNIYLATEFGGGVFWSNDGAETWNAANALAIVFELGIHPTNPSTLYAGHGAGVYKSTNGARDWVLMGNGLPNVLNYTSLAVDPSDGETVYAGATPAFAGGSPSIYKTTDGGDNWVETSNGFELDGVTALEIDPGNPSTLYAGGLGGFAATSILQKSTDRGATWATLDIGISLSSSVSTLAVDPFNSSLVYAGTNTDGVFKSEDGGTTWTEYSQGFPHVTIEALAINPTDSNEVLAAPRCRVGGGAP